VGGFDLRAYTCTLDRGAAQPSIAEPGQPLVEIVSWGDGTYSCMWVGQVQGLASSPGSANLSIRKADAQTEDGYICSQ
jgi:hypothetical protein